MVVIMVAVGKALLGLGAASVLFAACWSRAMSVRKRNCREEADMLAQNILSSQRGECDSSTVHRFLEACREAGMEMRDFQLSPEIIQEKRDGIHNDGA